MHPNYTINPRKQIGNKFVTPDMIRQFQVCPASAYQNINYPILLLAGSKVVKNMLRYYFVTKHLSYKDVRHVVNKTINDDRDLFTRVNISDIIDIAYYFYTYMFSTSNSYVVDKDLVLNIGRITTKLCFIDRIPIVSKSLAGNITIIDFGDMDFDNQKQFLKDMKVQSRIWGFYKTYDCLPHYYMRLILLPNNIKSFSIDLHAKDPSIILNDKDISFIIQGISQNISYHTLNCKCTLDSQCK